MQWRGRQKGEYGEETCMLHFTTSRGVTAVCVRPQLRVPPMAQAP